MEGARGLLLIASEQWGVVGEALRHWTLLLPILFGIGRSFSLLPPRHRPRGSLARPQEGGAAPLLPRCSLCDEETADPDDSADLVSCPGECGQRAHSWCWGLKVRHARQPAAC